MNSLIKFKHLLISVYYVTDVTSMYNCNESDTLAVSCCCPVDWCCQTVSRYSKVNYITKYNSGGEEKRTIIQKTKYDIDSSKESDAGCSKPKVR